MHLRYLIFSIVLLPFLTQGQTQNFWTKKADFPGFKRERAVGFSIGDYGYIGTGVDTAENVLKDFWQYDPSIDTWTQKADVPGPGRRDAVGFAVGGKGYIGTGIDNDESFSGVKLSDFYEYEPLSNTWLAKANFPGNGGLGIYFATAFTIDSKGYICCGKEGPNNYSDQLWEYKPSINQWTQRASFPGGVRYQLSSFSIGYFGYVGLGANQDVFKKDFWRYNPGTNSWSAIADLPASERGSASTFTIGERGFVCLGTDGGLLDDLWEYNPDTDQWVSRAPYGGTERKNAFSFTIGNKAYVGTGKGYSGKKGSVQEYTPMDVLSLDQLDVEVAMYPNPTSDFINLKWKNNSIKNFSILSVDGRIVETYNCENQNELTINLQDFVTGTYILTSFSGSNDPMSSQKLIIL